MSCYRPITAYYSRSVNPATGKRALQFSRVGAFTGEPLSLPCGKCIGCRLEKSRVWAIRCLHESKMHKRNVFVTLTYDNEHLPRFGTLVKRDLSLFLKRLRDWYFREHGLSFRYYACGEYGDISQRPHYHALLFGIDFDDKVLYSQGDYPLFTSQKLDELWGNGVCKIGEVNFETAAYTARYCVKKVDGPQREAGHYLVYDGDGEVFERVPEFAVMSRRPGVGAPYFAKYGREIRAHDSIVVNGREVPSIRYYDKEFEKLDEAAFRRVKRKRLPRNKLEWDKRFDEGLSGRVFAKETVTRAMLKQKRKIL